MRPDKIRKQAALCVKGAQTATHLQQAVNLSATAEQLLLIAEDLEREEIDHWFPPIRQAPGGVLIRKSAHHKPAATIAKVDRLFAKADAQRANLKDDPLGEVTRQKRRIKRAANQKSKASGG